MCGIFIHMLLSRANDSAFFAGYVLMKQLHVPCMLLLTRMGNPQVLTKHSPKQSEVKACLARTSDLSWPLKPIPVESWGRYSFPHSPFSVLSCFWMHGLSCSLHCKCLFTSVLRSMGNPSILEPSTELHIIIL